MTHLVLKRDTGTGFATLIAHQSISEQHTPYFTNCLVLVLIFAETRLARRGIPGKAKRDRPVSEIWIVEAGCR